MRPPAGAAYLIGGAGIALGVLGDSVVCWASGVVVVVVQLALEVRTLRAVLGGPYPAELTAALLEQRAVSWPARVVLRRLVRPPS